MQEPPRQQKGVIMKSKDILKSKRTWALIGLTALQIFKINIPIEISEILRAFTV